MPEKFRGMATVAAWTLFVAGWIALISGYVRMIGLYAGNTPPSGTPSVEVALLGGIASLALSVVLMKLRKSLE
jgi:hypothetical protein